MKFTRDFQYQQERNHRKKERQVQLENLKQALLNQKKYKGLITENINRNNFGLRKSHKSLDLGKTHKENKPILLKGDLAQQAKLKFLLKRDKLSYSEKKAIQPNRTYKSLEQPRKNFSIF